MDFGPKNKSEKETFAVEGFRVDVQHQIYQLIRERGVTLSELAKRLCFSEARTNRLFSDEDELTLRQVAKIFWVLGAECKISFSLLESSHEQKSDETAP